MRSERIKFHRGFIPPFNEEKLGLSHKECLIKKCVSFVYFNYFFICGEADRSGRGRCCSSSCCCCWGIWGDCFPISHVHSKWVHPEKTFLQNGCIQRKLFFKMGASRENFSSKWVYPEKSFLQNGCIQRNLFFIMGASRENFSSKRVHSLKKTFAEKLMHQDKTLLQNSSFTEFRKRIILSFKVKIMS